MMCQFPPYNEKKVNLGQYSGLQMQEMAGTYVVKRMNMPHKPGYYYGYYSGTRAYGVVACPIVSSMSADLDILT